MKETYSIRVHRHMGSNSKNRKLMKQGLKLELFGSIIESLFTSRLRVSLVSRFSGPRKENNVVRLIL